MPDHADLLRRLRANLDKYPGFVNLNAEAATAIETLLAQQKVLVAEVEAWRTHESLGHLDWGRQITIEGAMIKTDAAFPGGLTK